LNNFASHVAAADRDWNGGEAALTIADRAASPADAKLLLDALGLTGVSCRWDLARVCLVILERCRNGREFSSNIIRTYLPRRAFTLIAPAMTRMHTENLAELTGHVVPSTAPGARGRKVRCWRLTLAGERLSRSISPIPGMTPEIEALNSGGGLRDLTVA